MFRTSSNIIDLPEGKPAGLKYLELDCFLLFLFDFKYYVGIICKLRVHDDGTTTT